MSRLDSTDKGRGVLVPKPKSDVYTALLGIALAAILLGILCLCLEMNRYQWVVKATVTMAAPSPSAADHFAAHAPLLVLDGRVA